MTNNTTKTSQLAYKKFPFTAILGWSNSRFEVFDKCKRQYFYTYYSKFIKDVPSYKISQLRELTSVPLEIGNVVHDILEALLKRLQQSTNDIDESKFLNFAQKKVDEYFAKKTFMEKYYKYLAEFDMALVYQKVEQCLQNFIKSPLYSWIFMVAIRNRENWLIEPDGFGETRLNGYKAYCKMDFLLPVEENIYILDWKTGSADTVKHTKQLLGYAAAAHTNFGFDWQTIFPKIIYLYPEFKEFEIRIQSEDLERFLKTIELQTLEMYRYCKDIDQNIPHPMEKFQQTPSPSLCRQCKFQELCFPAGLASENMDFKKEMDLVVE